MTGHAVKEGASWEEVEEVGAEEVLLEDHALSAAADHRVSAGYGGRRLVSSWEEGEDVLEGLVLQRLEVEDQQNLQPWLLTFAGPVGRCWCL